MCYKVLTLVVLLSMLVYCECVYVYSSFWAPLLDPRILNYRVDATFDEHSGKNARESYQNKYGYRGSNLIADLGNGKPAEGSYDNKVYGDVQFRYTYPGAHNIGQ